ncbi:MAG: hypothetical protein ACXACU_09345 [Candidatus Hodarchaeales archaeon]|jgi:hypothetical protein
MNQKPYKKKNLEFTIKYLNYNGPLFIRYVPEFVSITQKQPTRIAASIETQ